MFVANSFVLGGVEGPQLGSGDIIKLKELFPENPIWKATTSRFGNVYYPTRPEAMAFLRELKEYRRTHEVNDKEYVTGNTTGTFLINSDLRSVFSELVTHFEENARRAPLHKLDDDALAVSRKQIWERADLILDKLGKITKRQVLSDSTIVQYRFEGNVGKSKLLIERENRRYGGNAISILVDGNLVFEAEERFKNMLELEEKRKAFAVDRKFRICGEVIVLQRYVPRRVGTGAHEA